MNNCSICKKHNTCSSLALYKVARDIGQKTLVRQLNTNKAEGHLDLKITKCPEFKEGEAE